MVTIIDRREAEKNTHGHKVEGLKTVPTGDSYSTYKSVDTKVPPKAHPVLREVSVNGVVIEERAILAEAQNHPAANPGAALYEAARALVVREILLQKASQSGYLETAPQIIEDKIETAEDAAIRRLIETEVDVPIATEEECHRHFLAYQSRFRSESIYEARHILLAAGEKDLDLRKSAESEARRIIDLLQERPQDFAEMALHYSACPSRMQGGNLGQITRGSTVGAFEKALESMTAGTLASYPVETRFGYHIVQLDRKIEGKPLPFEAVKGRIADWLEAQSWSRAVAQYVSILAGEAIILGLDINRAGGPLVQ